MQTLGKRTTNQFYSSENGFRELVDNWSKVFNSDRRKELTYFHYFLYAVLKGKDYRKTFNDGTSNNATGIPYKAWECIDILNSLAVKGVGGHKGLAKALTTDNVLWAFPSVTPDVLVNVAKFLPRRDAVTPISMDPYRQWNGEEAFDKGPIQEEYSYCFVREDLPTIQQVVQVGHVMDKAGHRFGHISHRNLVVLKSENSLDLVDISKQLQIASIDYVIYYDSDIGGATALATEPVKGCKRDFFKDHMLLRH